MKTKITFFLVLLMCGFSWNLLKAQSPVYVYMDGFGPGISNSFFPNTDGTMNEVTSQFYSGTKSLAWFVGTKPYADLKFTVWPVKDLSTHAAGNYRFEFYFKSPSVGYATKMYLKCYFRSKIGTNPAYDCTFNLTPTQLIADGQWHKVSIPLSSFVNATGNFTWTDVNFVNIYTDHTNLSGAIMYFDELKIVPAAQPTASTDYFRTYKSGLWNSTDTWESSFNNISWIAATAVPASTSTSVNILNSRTVAMEANQTVGELVLDAGSVLTVSPAKQLTINATFTNNGTLNLQSDASGTATILTPTTISGSGVTNVYQYLSSSATGVTGRNWYISSPVSAASSGTITTATGNGLVFYNVGGASWDDAGTTMEVMKGYIAKSPAQNTTVCFTGGSLNSGPMSVSNLPVGFNLVGNPYASYVNWTETTKTGVSTSIWYRSKSTGYYLFQTYNVAGEGVSVNGGTNMIPPLQAFWIKTTNSVNSLGFTNVMRSHQDQSVLTNRLKAPKEFTQQLVRLQVSNGTYTDEAVLYFNERAQNAVDEFDSQKMFNNIVDVPEIYTLIGKDKLVINGMNEIPYEAGIPLGFSTLAAGSFKIEVTGFDNFDDNTILLLKDKELNTEYDLTNGNAYYFESGVTNSSDRFSLIFKNVGISTGINETSKVNFQVYIDATNQLVISAPDESSFIIYTSLGQKICEGGINSTKTSVNRFFVSGIYFVEIQSGGNREITKVIIR